MNRKVQDFKLMFIPNRKINSLVIIFLTLDNKYRNDKKIEKLFDSNK